MPHSSAYDARAIANFVLDRAAAQGIGISNMHINKILYFAHGWFLANKKKPLIMQSFEAWEYGPVIQDLYHQFKKFERNDILERATRLNIRTAQYEIAQYDIAEGDLELLARLTDFYARIPPETLSERSHKEGSPWYCAWNYKGKSNPGMRIDNALIAEWFSSVKAREAEV